LIENPDRFWKLLETFGNFWKLVETFGNSAKSVLAGLLIVCTFAAPFKRTRIRFE